MFHRNFLAIPLAIMTLIVAIIAFTPAQAQTSPTFLFCEEHYEGYGHTTTASLHNGRLFFKGDEYVLARENPLMLYFEDRVRSSGLSVELHRVSLKLTLVYTLRGVAVVTPWHCKIVNVKRQL